MFVRSSFIRCLALGILLHSFAAPPSHAFGGIVSGVGRIIGRAAVKVGSLLDDGLTRIGSSWTRLRATSSSGSRGAAPHVTPYDRALAARRGNGPGRPMTRSQVSYRSWEIDQMHRRNLHSLQQARALQARQRHTVALHQASQRRRLRPLGQ